MNFLNEVSDLNILYEKNVIEMIYFLSLKCAMRKNQSDKKGPNFYILYFTIKNTKFLIILLFIAGKIAKVIF